MKFSHKILIWTIIIMAAAFGMGGYFFVNFVFDTSMNREIGQAMDESSILQFAFETAALNIPSKYDVLQDSTIEEIGSNLEKGGQGTGRLLRLSDENRTVLYASEGFVEDTEFLMQIQEDTRIYQVIRQGERYYVQTGTVIDALDRILYLETMKDVTGVFEERTQGFAVYRNLTFAMLLVGSVVTFFIAAWLTRPIRLLTGAARKMAEGDYSSRAQQISNDEMGQLTCDFNYMAAALEENIHKLEEEIRAREDFIAAFSHELKTPLTAIIGYADLLRSRKLDEEKHFLSANYIYTEGKRLETMSLRLLDIIVTRRGDIKLEDVDVAVLFEYIRDMFGEKEDVELRVAYDKGKIRAEANLLKSVLLNLTDNAYKASFTEDGSKAVIELQGLRGEDGYFFGVRDYGVGIPEEEKRKITEAFYMVDKSRARSKNGAGLGLALCTEILKLHHSELVIESTVGEGSLFGFTLPCEEVTVDGTQKTD
ncbi:MAG: HAMP domain-containing histidine kinase [Lachnospiraceae bacterium]|nr:HAMP domain-containing histidine kinase [Lachnospiraceae bacterium]